MLVFEIPSLAILSEKICNFNRSFLLFSLFLIAARKLRVKEKGTLVFIAPVQSKGGILQFAAVYCTAERLPVDPALIRRGKTFYRALFSDAKSL